MNLKLLSPPQWSLTCALLIAGVCLLRLLLQKRPGLPKRVWPLLWWVVLLRLLLPVSMPVSMPVSLPFSQPQNLWQTARVDVLPLNNEIIHLDSDTANNTLINQLNSKAYPETTHNTENFWLLLWAAGAITSASFFSLVYWRSHRRFQQAKPLENRLIQQWLNAHPLRRPIMVRQSSEITAPLTYGLLHPVILLPDKGADWDWQLPSSLHYALLHEWTHIRRFDAAGKLLAAAALCLHWFNPAVWLFFRLFSRDLEMACDESVVRYCGGTTETRRGYALALLSWAESRPVNPVFSNFGINNFPQNMLKKAGPKKDVIEERIVAIMNVKKVSFLGIAAACLLLLSTAAAFATNSPNNPDGENLPIANMNQTEALDYGSDFELHQLLSAEVRANWADLLAPYEEFGLVWQFDDPDFDGNGLKMYYQGREVRGIYDEPKGLWLTEHTGDSSFAPDAGELYTVYTDGQLSGLGFAGEAEQREWDKLRRQPVSQNIQEYEPFGLEINEQEQLVYEGKLVRYFWDGYDIMEDGVLLGKALHFEYLNPEGEIDLRTRRGVIANGDGSVDQFGGLQGLEVYVEENIEAIGQQQPAQAITYALGDTAAQDGVIHTSQQIAYSIYKDNPEEPGLTIKERLAEYEQFGLEYREVMESDGVHTGVYFQGELLAGFVDVKPDGSCFSTQSNLDNASENVALTEYDESGQLVGLRLATPEEANQHLNQNRQAFINFLPGLIQEK